MKNETQLNLKNPKNPKVAGFLSVISGLGYYYNGYKQIALSSFFVLVVMFNQGSMASTEVTLNAGTIFYVKPTETLDPNVLNTGDTIDLVVVGDVNVDNIVIKRDGTPVIGTVSDAQSKGALGKPAKLTISENIQILRAQENTSKTHKAELDNINIKLNHMEGSIKRMEGDIRGMKEDMTNTKNIAYLALNHAAQNRLDIADLKVRKSMMLIQSMVRPV